MVILHVVDSMQTGGAETLVAQLCRIQRATGHSPAVHCLLRIGVLGEALAREGIPVSGEEPVNRFRALWARLRALRPDVVHCHNANATIVAAVVARFAGVRAVICTRHGLVPPELQRKRERKFWIAARFCDRVVAVCDAARQNLLRARGSSRSRVMLIRNGADIAPAGGPPRPPSSGFRIVTVARLVKEKDQQTLLRAFALAKAAVADLELCIIGDGPLMQDLRALAESLQIDGSVQFLGERSDVGSWLASANLFALSSVSEGLPISVLEAMAAGLPLLLTNVGGMPEMVHLAGGGLVVEPSNPAAMADGMIDLAQRRAAIGELGRANQIVYREQLTAERMGAAYVALYEELLAR